jgi:glycyl-tRNA synthetase
MYVQDVLQTLAAFWGTRGCLLWQPYHTEVGAGTSNPATFLRVLGPEPWWVAYVEPSIRPTDGRYGENPNRLQHYYQYQVILKPSPPDVQELFLESLEALGLDLNKHDFRFVEDNWQSPSLGAWGLGWEAWLDGMEILQFTYFQECGGVKLDVRACELTYGVERICMYLQGVENVYDLRWAANGTTYGDIYHASEVEFCKYNFQAADTAKLFQVFDIWESEAKRLLDLELILPAYDHCLRLSHLFNVLDARGALSVTERGRFLLRCRSVAERCARGFLAQRESMVFPLLRLPTPATSQEETAPEPATLPSTDRADLLIEVGVEELPDADIRAVLDQAQPLIDRLFSGHGLDHGPICVWVAPRRIALRIADVPAKQQDVEKEVRGPRRQAAQNDKGEWSVAAQRFAEANGATTSHIYFQSDGKAEYCYVKARQKGKTLPELLSGIVNDFVARLHFYKSMGWEDSTLVFSRPIRWLVVLHGTSLVPVRLKIRDANERGPERFIRSGSVSFGHRRLAPGPVSIEAASGYLDAVRSKYVLADPNERRSVLATRVAEQAAVENLVPEQDEDLLDEIANLVEWPEPIVGEIPHDALALPEEIIITPMKVHQRYIPLRTPQGRLSTKFICVANGPYNDTAKQIIRQGNERVLNARLRDARYFWDTDTQQSLWDFAAKLDTVLFHQKLGTVADKIARLKKLYATLKSSLPAVDDAKMDESLSLMKADLTTQMVFEFDSLEGVVGMLYARKEGIDKEVARAIFEHRLPRRAGDSLPTGKLGLVAGLLDRFDTLAGYFGIGMRVKGTSDPFSLRRTALAVLSLIEANDLDINLETALRSAIENYGPVVAAPDDSLEALLAFVSDRLQVMLREQGFPHDLVAAALAVHGARPRQLHLCLNVTSKLAEDSVQFLAEQAKRIERIVTDPAPRPDPAVLDNSDSALIESTRAAESRIRDRVAANDFPGAFGAAEAFAPEIARYFETTLVNAADDALRRSRHALLRDVLATLRIVLDFTRIEKDSKSN